MNMVQLMPDRARFLSDTLTGLKSKPKYLSSKYFYDREGDRLFQQIMQMEEYYLTRAEMEILETQSGRIADLIARDGTPFDLLELGAGDATKSVHLLRELLTRRQDFTYLPVDISPNIISCLDNTLPGQIPGLKMQGLNGEYLEMLAYAASASRRRKVILFMGANIGNMDIGQAQDFLLNIRKHMAQDDLLLIGFDLKKDPRQILQAYNDLNGITRAFNLNLLARMNRELDADFRVGNFGHYATYDPESGACKSFLISLKEQTVRIGDADKIHFLANEYIFTEISQKYAPGDIEALASKSGFRYVKHFTDSNGYFVDMILRTEQTCLV